MKTEKIRIILCAVLVFALTVVLSSGGADAAAKKATAAKAKTTESKKTAAAKAWDCAACHKDKKMLPESHVPIKDMPYDGCVVCHVAGGTAGTLKTKVPGSHLHALRGMKCEQCHGKVKKPEPVEMAKCLACHGETAKLAEKTANVKPHNPHQSPHYGTDADCNLCHHQHAKSENLCAQCHKFDFVVP